SVEPLRVQAPEVSDPGKRRGQEPVQELPHARPAERHLRSDGHPLPELERGDGLAGSGDGRLLAGDRGQVGCGSVQELAVPDRVALPQWRHTSWTFERSMNISCWMIPPCGTRLVGLACFVARATPSTITRFFWGRTLTTRPRLPRSLPAITWTSSFFRMSVFG